jgi:nucleoside-diphosphate-sugar epimerase
VDWVALEALVGAARKRGAGPVARTPFLIYTSDAWVVGKAVSPATEEVVPNPTPLVAWRVAHERLMADAGADGLVRTAIVRPGTVYGRSRGIIAGLVKEAKNGLMRVIGTGDQHWACVYDRDLADLYVRIMATDDASGIFHANDEADEHAMAIVNAIADQMATRPDIRHVSLDEARATMGLYADALALDQRLRSRRAQALGWMPTRGSVVGSVARLFEEYRDFQGAAA